MDPMEEDGGSEDDGEDIDEEKEGEQSIIVKSEEDAQPTRPSSLLPRPGGASAGGMAAGGVRRLGSVREGGPDLSMRPAGGKSKFAPKIPAKLAVVKPEPEMEVEKPKAEGGGRGRGKDGDRGRGRGRGANARPQAPAIVAFRGTAASAQSNRWAGGSSGGGGGGFVGSGRGAARSRTRPQEFLQAGEGGDGMDIDVDNLVLPTTLPMPPKPPWDPSVIQVDNMMSVKYIKKLIRSISIPAASEIVGEASMTAVLRNEPWTLEALGITEDVVKRLESRRLKENPMLMSKAATDLFAQKGTSAGTTSAVDGEEKHHQPSATMAEAVRPPGIMNVSVEEMLQLGQDEKDRLLFFQLPTSLPFQNQQRDGMEHEEKVGDDPESEVLSRHPKNLLSGQPAGWMGKMRVHKSGKVTLKLGDGVFDISEAAQCNFLQQVVARTHESDDLYHIGDVFGRLLVTPDLEKLLKSVQ